MTKNLKGNYAAGTSYSVGDVVKESGFYYILQKEAAAGTPVTDTRFWGLLSDPNTVDLLEDFFPNAKTLVLASSTASSNQRFKITVVDNGTISATEITS